MANRSTATTQWHGDLQSGSGRVTLGSGLGGDMEVDWRARTAGAAGKTTPEELIAAAHSACFSMALSNILAGGGNPPDSLSTNAVAVFESGESGFHISSIELSVSGSVPGISAEDFADAARKAKDDCPVSKALSDDVTVSVQARLI